MKLIFIYLIVIVVKLLLAVAGGDPDLNLIILYFLTRYKLINLPIVIIYAYLIALLFSEVTVINVGSIIAFFILSERWYLRLANARVLGLLAHFTGSLVIYSGGKYLSQSLYYWHLFDWQVVAAQAIGLIIYFGLALCSISRLFKLSI